MKRKRVIKSSCVKLAQAMVDSPPAVASGSKTFGTIRDNSGVVLGDASGYAQVIGTQNIYQYEPDEKLSKIRRWLSAPEPTTNYQNALKLRQANTCGWFLEGTEYIRWKTEPGIPLWLHGIPGCGKTILCSAVLCDVLQYCQDSPGRVAAYFFFNFNDVQKQDQEKMLRSLIWQLLQHSQQIPPGLENLVSSCGSGQPSVESLQKVLRSMIQEVPQVYIILDALDECAHRADLMETLQTIVDCQNLHLLVTSRREQNIESTLEDFIDDQSRICLQSKLVDKDIQLYVHHRLATDKALQKWRKYDIRREIENALREGAKGMFRWAACQLDILAKCRNRAALRKALSTLPPTLDQTYERILSAIDEDDSEYAIRILRWLTFSEEPLSVDQVAEVIAIDITRDPAFNRDEVLEDPLDALNICSSLVTTTSDLSDTRLERHLSGTRLKRYLSKCRSRETVTLAHYSVKEYLLSNEIWRGEVSKYGMRHDICHAAIARSCLSYLLQLKQPQMDEDFLQVFRLARYSAKHWSSHARKTAGQRDEIDRLAFRLCYKKSSSYVNCIRLWNPERSWEAPKFQKTPEEIYDPLYYTALLDLTGVAKLLLDADANINAQGTSRRYGNALRAASLEGHEQMVKLLFDAGADIYAQSEEYFAKTVYRALSEGDEQAIKRLLDAGADVNERYGPYSNALEAASFAGHEQMVKLLLDAGADVNAQNEECRNALHAASYKGHEQVVKLLLDAGANVDAQSGHYGNALQGASGEGHEHVVKLLLNVGANVNAQSGYYGNALQAASRRGREQMVKLLLDAGANVDALDGFYGSAIQAASYEGHEQVVKLLLDVGANVNAQSGRYGNALQAASSEGHEQVVKLLLDAGANITAQGGQYGNALQAASSEGHEQVVKLLLDVGANVNAQSGRYGNALQAASYEGHEQVVKLLLDAGANITAQGGQYGNALQAASSEGHEQVVKLLLDAGADVNAQGGEYRNALQAASRPGHEQVVKLLLAAGADVNAQNKYRSTTLQVASSQGHEQVVKLLLDAGANVNARGGRHGNALQAASYEGHEQVVKLLLAAGADAKVGTDASMTHF